jgi:hypothetical protein
MFGMFNAATTGVDRKKSTSSLFNVPLGAFADEIAWVKQFLAERGYHVEEAVLDQYVERWNFYTAGGVFLITLQHDLIERIMTARIRQGVRAATEHESDVLDSRSDIKRMATT